MRTLFLFLVTVAVGLLTIGAVVPELFVLSLLGMVLLAGTASVALATMQDPGPHPHY
jgi:hypothetical protein